VILLCPDPLQAVDRWDLAQPRRSEGPLQCSEQVPAISPNGLGVRLAGGGAGRQAILLDAAALALDPLRMYLRHIPLQPVGRHLRQHIERLAQRFPYAL
jgi:hypothetical protein